MLKRSQSQKSNESLNNRNRPSHSRSTQPPDETQQRTNENQDELVHNCVRFLLYKAGGGVPIRKIDIQKQVLKNVGRNYAAVFKKAKQVLNEVYGLNVYECEDEQSSVRYLISNLLPYKKSRELNITHRNLLDSEEPDVPEDACKVLIMIVLTHIFMSNNSTTQNSLFSFLELIQIDPEVRHPIFGNVKKYISELMVPQKYLTMKTDEITRQVTYSWGPRAEREISKHELLKFVCKIYKDRTPKSWTNQFQVANNQFAEGEEQNGVEHMEVVD
ncbi:hypothetical protein FQR65_LT01777 [Abscondita terminalis]|nr:hypothetical protein FQR65_LT01777 [Abscondita terminalis]